MDRQSLLQDVHLFSVRDEHFLLDVEGNRLYSLSPEAYRLALLHIEGIAADSFSFRSLRAGRELSSVLKSLKSLTPEAAAVKSKELEQEPCVLRGLWLGLAHACNLGCSYCFANTPNYLQNHRPFMSEETARRAIDFLMRQSPDQGEYDLIFFGGEPLLRFDVLRKVVEYTASLATQETSFGYSITTNGTLLTPDVYQYLTEHDVSMMLSIDGTKALHDRNRPYRDGRPSWDTIVNNISQIADIGSRVMARVTIASTDTPLVEIYETMRSLGFIDIALVEICPNSGEMPVFPPESLSRWKDQYLELAEHIAATDPDVYEGGLQSLSGYMQSLRKRERSFYCCSTGISSLYVTPDGDLYPCMRLITERGENRMGSLDTGVDMAGINRFAQNHIFNKRCRECWARYLCGGTCYGDAFAYSGDIRATIDAYCTMTQHKIHVAAYILKNLNDRRLLPSVEGREKSGSLLAKFRRFAGMRD